MGGYYCFHGGVGIKHPLPPTWPLDVMFQCMGSLQCLLVSLSGLSEGLIMWVFPLSRPRPGLPLTGQRDVATAAPCASSPGMVM